jgi:hypothetical protein
MDTAVETGEFPEELALGVAMLIVPRGVGPPGIRLNAGE